MSNEEIDIPDLMNNLFTDKYSYEDKVRSLAKLEKNKELFIKIIKQYHPEYYLSFDDSIASFNLAEDIKANFKNFGTWVLMNNEIQKDGLQKAAEFWENMKPIEHTTGSFKTKDGTEIGYSSTTFKRDEPKIEDADFEVIQPKQLPEPDKK